MTIEETRQIVIQYFKTTQDFPAHKKGCMLQLNGRNYRIMPDDAFYHSDRVLLFEYENNKRPVESISKYFWLFNNTEWLKENIKIKLLLTINNQEVEAEYAIRTESIQILGKKLNQEYPNNFDFHFLNYSELTEENLLAKLAEMTIAI